MAYRFLPRTPGSYVFADDPNAVDPRVPSVGMSNFHGTLEKGDVVGVVVERTTPILVNFHMYSSMLKDGEDANDGRLPCTGRYYPSEMHFFRVVDTVRKGGRAVAVEPLFLTSESSVIHRTVDAHFNREVDLPVDRCNQEDLLRGLLRDTPSSGFGISRAEVRRRLAERHAPMKWAPSNFSKWGKLREAVLGGTQVRTRTSEAAEAAAADKSEAGAPRARSSVRDALEVSLKRFLCYVDFRKTLDLDPTLTLVRDYVAFVHAHQREFVHTLDLDEEAGELAALLDMTGTIDAIRHHVEVEIPDLVRHILGEDRPTVKSTCSLSLFVPVSVGPSNIPFAPTRLKQRHINCVMRTDPCNVFLVPPQVVDWGGEPLDDCVLAMLTAGSIVRVTFSSGGDSFSRVYCRLLQQLDAEHFLAFIEDNGFAHMSERTVCVVNVRAISEVPLAMQGNHAVYVAYRRFLRRTHRERQRATRGVLDEEQTSEGEDEDEEDEEDVELDFELDVPFRVDMGDRLPISYDPLLALWDLDSKAAR